MIKKKNMLKDNCKNSKQLFKYLCEKARTHNCYKCYSTLERITKIRDTNALYIGNGSKWNDITDRSDFNDESNEFINFGKSFSFSKEESVAMWMLYGGIHKLGGMIDFTQKGINSILETKKIYLGYFDGDDFIEISELSREKFNIFLIDMIYYKENTRSYYIKRSDESYHNLSKSIFSKLKLCKKAYGWQYENECRLIISINKMFIPKKCDTVKIDLSGMDMGKSFERIYRGPNYPLDDVKNSLPSKLADTIDWSLCDESNCQKNNHVKASLT